MSHAFAGQPASTLRELAAAFRSGQLGSSLSRLALQRITPCNESLANEVLRLSSEGLAPQHLAVLLDVAASAAEARMGGAVAAELVWTGPEHTTSHSRDTLVVVQELFACAERCVTVSTFVVQGASVFEPLARRMEERPNLTVRVFLHVPRDWKDTRHDSEILRELAENLRREWHSPRMPEVFFDPRSLLSDPTQRATWHAKCVLVDEDVAFVTSANFTEWAHHRNVEAGVLIRNRHFADQLRAQFDALVQTKQVRRLPGF